MADTPTNKLTHLFDIRNVIGALLAIYGVVLTIAGFAPGYYENVTKARATTPSTCTSAPRRTGGPGSP
jgi:hypothetical protein